MSSLAALGRTRQADAIPNLEGDDWLLTFTNRDATGTISSMQEQLQSMHIPIVEELIENEPEVEQTWNDTPLLPDFIPAGNPMSNTNLDGLMLEDDDEETLKNQ